MVKSFDKLASANADRVLRNWALVVTLAAISAEILQTLLVGHPFSFGFLPKAHWVDFLYFTGAFLGTPACVLWIGGKNLPVHRFLPICSVALGCALYIFQMLVNEGDGLYSPASVLCLVLGPLGILSAVVVVRSFFNPRESDAKRWMVLFLKIALLLDALSVVTASGLASNRLIFPATWDYIVYRLDDVHGNLANYAATLFSTAIPMVKALTLAVYGVLVFAFYAVVGIAIKRGEIERLHVWRTLIIPFALAFPLYAFLPLSGPVYTFFSGEFPNFMPNPAAVPISPVVIPPAYRNGMPSMHLTGAILVWMLSVAMRHRVATLMSSLLVMGTAWATIATGEHYFLDLVVALPYAAFVGTALIAPERLKGNCFVSFPIWVSGTFFVLWLLLMRSASTWLAHNTVIIKVLSSISITIALVVFWGWWGAARKNLHTVDPEAKISHLNEVLESAPRWIFGVFIASGFAGLIYEVVYAKALAITFGSTALASYTVLATYMGGMALGAWLGGYLADKSKNLLWTYAICEAIIGAYAALTPTLFSWIQHFYVYFSLDVAPDAPWLTPFRLVLGATCLSIPTVLMGATLPLMFKHLRNLGISSGRAIAPLYAANVGGAAAGSILAGYFLLPAVGRNGGTYIAAIFSFLIALYVLEKLKQPSHLLNSLILSPIPKNDYVAAPEYNKKIGIAAICTLFIGGAVTLGLEVNSMHLLAIVAGNSVYAFGLMLATFLAGLGLGSIVGERLMRHVSRIWLMAAAQCGIALTIALTAQLWDDLPAYFSSFSLYPISLSFSAREAIRALVCLCAMFPPAFFIGISYPVAMSLATDWLSPTGDAKGLGFASAINTFGNILGVVLVGFWLLPAFGSQNTTLILALVALSLGIFSTMLNSSNKNLSLRRSLVEKASAWIPAGLAVVSISFFPAQWNYDDLSSGSNVYFSEQNWGKIIDHAESVEGGLTTVAKNADGVSILLTNGKFQGNDSAGGEMIAQESFALFPLLHTAKRGSALVIGYGTGMTTKTFHELGFKKIDVAELSKDIVALANKHFSAINSRVSDAHGVSMHYTDGRNFLLTQTRKFDVISIEITSIWFAGAANLYNKEFYALAKKRLAEGGSLQQWIQLHHISSMDLIYAIGSVRSEFKYVWIYMRGGQGIIVASNDANAKNFPGEEFVFESKKDSNMELQPIRLKSHMLLSPAGVDNMILSFDPSMRALISTDQNLYLEHSTPKGNALRDVVDENASMLAGFEPIEN